MYAAAEAVAERQRTLAPKLAVPPLLWVFAALSWPLTDGFPPFIPLENVADSHLACAI